jgi:iron complex outermembrane receptor protein
MGCFCVTGILRKRKAQSPVWERSWGMLRKILKTEQLMRKTACFGLFLAATTVVRLPVFAQAVAVSEGDFLNDMPMVLSVSRLSQRLDEAPGAVTVIDREMIRLSGARDVAELLRWVPGFQVTSSFEADTPTAYYHGAFNEFTSRMQVLIDGRTAYSTYLSGSVGLGLLSVAMEDIERIEVLRGSNSAAYGARAFLGVINIITRLPVESYGWALSAKAGENLSLIHI